MRVPTPTADKLTDLFFNCSVAVLVTDGSGTVLLENKATQALTARETTKRSLTEVIDLAQSWDDILLGLAGTGLVENVPCVVKRGGEADISAAANVASARGAGDDEYMFWMLRPELTETLPSEGSAVPSAMTDAGKWIASVNSRSAKRAADLTDSRFTEILELFFHHAPAGIHLLGDDGSVVYANKYDITLVGHDADPTTFLGHHVRQVYQDHRVVEDFMGRWGEDAPIINFRANFVRKDGAVEPVLIYSTANAEDGFQNTRCIVFRDPSPNLPRNNVSAFDFEF